MSRVKCHSLASSSSSCPSSSTSTPHTRLPSVPENGWHKDEPNVSPHGLSASSQPSTAELVKEIATLEFEVIQLEQYLLSLYRTAFERHLFTLSSVVMERGFTAHRGSQFQDVDTESCCKDDINIQRSGKLQQSSTFPVCSSASSDNGGHLPPAGTPKGGHKSADSGIRSLADLLGAPLINHIPKIPSKLSEEILRCMCAIYCKLAEPPVPYSGMSASPASSLSSSFTSSEPYGRDSWNPLYTEEGTFPNDVLNEKNGPYSEMLEVPKISIDDERFNYAASKLQTYRSLIQRLEKVDPRKMNHEEKLAFWINIHNALVMHAHLAYGIKQNRVKSTSLTLKASYNVGGHSVNACIIQTSILCCCQRRSASWVQTVFSPATKLQTGDDKHAYCLDYPEPLVHFALSSGAYSDPAVRIYTAKCVVLELHLAKDQFIQTSVSIYKRKKVILPKILYYFAKDASLNLYALLEMVNSCLSEAQQKALQKCQKGRPENYIQWSTYNTSFRFIIHKKLAKGRTSIYE